MASSRRDHETINQAADTRRPQFHSYVDKQLIKNRGGAGGSVGKYSANAALKPGKSERSRSHTMAFTTSASSQPASVKVSFLDRLKRDAGLLFYGTRGHRLVTFARDLTSQVYEIASSAR